MTTMTIDQPTDRQAQALTILQRSVCLTLRCHYLGNHRVVDTEEVVDAFRPEHAGDIKARAVNKTAFRSAKKLIDSKELTPVTRTQGQAKSFLRSIAIAAHRVFGERTYIVPLGMLQQAHATLTQFRDECRAEAAALALRYEGAIARQQLLLGPLFRASDYKTPAEVAEAFDIEWDYVSFAAQEKLETVDRALFELAQDRYEARMAAAYDEVRLVLREAAREIVAGVARSLTPGPDGKRKAFRSTVLDDLAGFIETFSIRDIANDAELGAIVAQLRGLTAGLDVETLRDSDAVRASVLAEALRVTDALDALVVPFRRAMRLPGQALW